MCGGPISAATPDNLIEGAKKDGKMIFYTSVETEFARVLTSGFEAKYPFIKTDIFRTGIRPEGYPTHLKTGPSRVELAEKILDYRRGQEALFVR